MLSKIFRRPKTAPAPARIPAGERAYAIGDIHGCLGQLDDLLAQIDADDRARGPAATTLVFLGDYVDRGPASAQVLDRLSALASRPDTKARFLLGNHEEMFLGALAGDPKMQRLFCRVGGRETALSYGISAEDYEGLDYDELTAWLIDTVPPRHRDFLAAMDDQVEVGDYLFVHAGIRPGVSLEEQVTGDLRWIRRGFLDHRGPHDRMVVHGHTITGEVEFKDNRIGVDTGAYTGGPLSALGLEGEDRWVLTAAVD